MSTLRILLAEDNLLNRKVVLQMLKKLGYDANVASNGHEVVAMAQKSRYDVIFMDLMMPQLDGFGAAMRIRALESSDHRAIIIALTANSMGSDRTRSVAAGMDDFMMKPFMLGSLKQKLHSVEAILSKENESMPGEENMRPGKDINSEDNSKPLDTSLPLETADLVDRSVLRALASMVGEDDPAYLKEILNDFLTDAERLRGEIHKAVQAGNHLSLRQAAHSLKSTSAMFGALKLSDLCTCFENAAIEQNLGAIQMRLEEFDRTIQGVHTALVEMVESEAY